MLHVNAPLIIIMLIFTCFVSAYKRELTSYEDDPSCGGGCGEDEECEGYTGSRDRDMYRCVRTGGQQAYVPTYSSRNDDYYR